MTAPLNQDLNAIINGIWFLIFILVNKPRKWYLIEKLIHPTFLFKYIPLNNSSFRKHLCLTLNIKWNFSEHIKNIIKRLAKLRVFYVNFDQFCQGYFFSLYVYKTFIRSRLDYTDIVYDQDYNSTFHNKLKSVKQSACLIYQENICSNALFVQGFV